MTDTLTTAAAAAQLGCKPVTIRAYIARALLPATKHGRDWQITRGDLDQFAAQYVAKPGRPPIGRARPAREE